MVLDPWCQPFPSLRCQVRSFKFPKREKMDALKEQWIVECGSTPIGNIKGSEWASGARDAQVSQEVLVALFLVY